LKRAEKVAGLPGHCVFPSRLEAGIAIDVEYAFEVCQMGCWPLGSSVRLKQIDCRQRLRPAPAALLAGVTKDISSLSARIRPSLCDECPFSPDKHIMRTVWAGHRLTTETP
jgi:hypothetical protein